MKTPMSIQMVIVRRTWIRSTRSVTTKVPELTVKLVMMPIEVMLVTTLQYLINKVYMEEEGHVHKETFHH